MSDETDYLNMSDDAFMEQSLVEDKPAAAEEDPAQTPTPVTAEADDAAGADEAAEDEEGEEESTDEGEAAGSDESEQDEDDAAEESDEAESDAEADTKKDAAAEDDTDDAAGDKKDTPAVDYAKFHSEITQTFKANGKDFKVDNAADAIQLMQMGVNYNKKMAALKPALKTVRLLEKHNLLDEGKLSFLIDINRKDPQAIAKLLQDSKIDPMDVNVDEGSKYVAPDRSVDEREMELNGILDDLKESPKYADLLNTVSNVWDRNSKQAVADSPQVLNVLHDHMVNGVYDLITESMQRERTLGRLKGLNDLEAYRQVGDDLYAKGGFNHLFPAQVAAQKQGQEAPTHKIIPKKDVQKDASRNEKRRAASPTKTTVNSGKPQGDVNPLAQSDEEFMKEINPHFL